MLLLIVLLNILPVIAGYTDEALADLVTSLPGDENIAIDFKQFSGYLNIPGQSGEYTKYMHYWFVESMNDPETDPLALWTNGGPGCSGMIGFLTEQGPFRPNKDMTLSLNDYAWNTVANMLFIESPAGVGFSYSTDTADYTTGDNQTAIDNYNLIQAFLNRFPDYRKNDFYLTSESYGGHYIPTLSKKIVDENSNPDNELPDINFKGLAIGNPQTDLYSAVGAMIDTFWGHQLIAKPTYDEYTAKCSNYLQTVSNFSDLFLPIVECGQLYIEMNQQIGNLNKYALDYPVCIEDSTTNHKGFSLQSKWLLHGLTSTAFPKLTTNELNILGLNVDDNYEPCETNYMEEYLNQDTVKQALHVKNDIEWLPCASKLKFHYNYQDAMVSTAPIYNYLINNNYNLNILIYSGDDDSICSTVGTQSWIWDLGYEVAGNPWETYTFNDQTAGYLTQWRNTKMGFLTIHGAGHEVPSYKPDVALDMFKRYLNGEFTNK